MAKCALCGNTEPCRGEGFPFCKEEKDIETTDEEKQDKDK
jgi:hypothetical protein